MDSLRLIDIIVLVGILVFAWQKLRPKKVEPLPVHVANEPLSEDELRRLAEMLKDRSFGERLISHK